MGRPLRAFTAGIYHVTAHASDTRYLFLSDDDRDGFLERLAFTVMRVGLDLLAYTLMGNHYHVLVRTPDARLSTQLQSLHTSYSRHHNRLHGRKAHLFLAHCSATAVATDEHLSNSYRYLALNPVEAGLVLHPLDWPWSSARAHAGVEPPRIPLDESALASVFDYSPEWRLSYRELIDPARAEAA